MLLGAPSDRPAPANHCRATGSLKMCPVKRALESEIWTLQSAISRKPMDLYVILGLERGATLADVKRAYKRLARKYHPDINPGDRMSAAHFREIAEAYATLSDPDRRRRYDATGTVTTRTEGQTFGFEGFDFSVSVSGADASTFGDLFADVLFQRDPRRQESAADRGADLHQSMTLSFERAMRGAEWTMTVTRHEHCRTCKGLGHL